MTRQSKSKAKYLEIRFIVAEKTAGSRSHDHWVRKHFQQADKSGRGSVNEVEFLTMANALNVGLSPTKLKAKFKARREKISINFYLFT